MRTTLNQSMSWSNRSIPNRQEAKGETRPSSFAKAMTGKPADRFSPHSRKHPRRSRSIQLSGRGPYECIRWHKWSEHELGN